MGILTATPWLHRRGEVHAVANILPDMHAKACRTKHCSRPLIHVAHGIMLLCSRLQNAVVRRQGQ